MVRVTIILVLLVAIGIAATYLTLYFLHRENNKNVITTTAQPSSGVVAVTGKDRPLSQWQKYPGQVPDPANGTQVATFPSLTTEQCAAKCRSMSSCGVFATNTSNDQCTIFAGAGIFNYSPYVNTYIVPTA